MKFEQGSKIEYSYQDLGLEMAKYFKEKWLWTLFYKYPEDSIRQAFKICQTNEIKSLSYLVGILKNHGGK